jgi:hypothetical protein
MIRRADVQVFHPVLGSSVKNGATDTCSRCGRAIPEEYVPTMLWNHSAERGSDLMWVFCGQCEPSLLQMLMPRPAP